MGLAGVLTSLFSAAAALVVTPALLLVAGPRIAAHAPSAAVERRWYRLGKWVTSHHMQVALIGVALLVAGAGQVLHLKLTLADQTAIPQGVESRQTADTGDRDFIPNIGYPVTIAVDLARQPHYGYSRPLSSLSGDPAVSFVSPMRRISRDAAMLQLIPSQAPYSRQSQQLVDRLRGESASLLVGGTTAEFVDLKRSILQHAPLALALAALTTIAVLLVMTRSLLLPIKGMLFSVLNLAATFGLLVLIFQSHALGVTRLLGYHGPSAIETSVTVVILASAFGLATDYSVLLLSRITEEHRAGHTNEEAVALGMERTGRVITSSALLLAVAVLALASSRIYLVKELTVGQAIAILLDATLVRMLLVPAFMRMLGPLNWWLPGRFGRPPARGALLAHD
jgi:RND superfamily putative drug exporter